MNHSLRSAAACLLALLFCLSLSLPAFAAVPEKPDSVYVSDMGSVISATTESYIKEKANALFALSGAQIVILTVRDPSLYNLEDYAYEVFNAWGIGAKELNNGVLFVMNIATEDYWCTSGYGIDDLLSSFFLDTLLQTAVEPSFAVGDYDAAARGFFDAMFAELESYYDVNISAWDGKTYLYPAGGQAEEELTFIGVLTALLPFIIFMAIFIFAFVKGRRSGAPIIFFGGPRFYHHGPHFHHHHHHHGGFSGGFGGGGSRGGFSGGGFGGGFGGGGSRGGGAGRR